MAKLPTYRLQQCGEISRVGIGTWATFGPGADLKKIEATISAALDAGIDHVDTAPSYGDGGAEEWLGRFLPADGRRVLVSTKAFFHPKPDADRGFHGLGRKSLFRSVEGSLARLKRDRIDLLYCHRPDPDTPLEETLAALGELRRQGKINGWGVSRWPADLVRKAAAMAPDFDLPIPSAVQEPCNRLYAEPARLLAAELKAIGIPVIGYSVMARGALTGKYLGQAENSGPTRDDRSPWQTTPRDIARIERLVELARRGGLTPAMLLIADALRAGPCAAILTSASSPEQLAGIVAGIRLAGTRDDDKALDDIFDGPSD